MPNWTGINTMSFLGGYALQSATGDSESSQLQSTISAATSGVGELPPGVTHHPITCTDGLQFDENGVFSCKHNEVPADDPRTHAALVHSLALLIIEFGLTYGKVVPMADPLMQSINEKKIYEEVVNLIVDFVAKEFVTDGEARLRIYSLVAENFAGMVKSLSKPSTETTSLIMEKN